MISLMRNGRPVTIAPTPPRVQECAQFANPPHDPLPQCYLPTVLRELAHKAVSGGERAYEAAAGFLCRHCGYGKSAETADDQIFIRSPRIRYKHGFGGVVACHLTWLYDGHELSLAFDGMGDAILDGRRVSEERAVAAVCEWNGHVIRGEARRIREAHEANLACVMAGDEEGFDD